VSSASDKIRTKITEGGSTIDAEDGTMIGLHDHRTRNVRWEPPDDLVRSDRR